LFGILCLEIDTISKTNKELFCKQIEWPNVDQILESDIPSICDRNKDDMLVTWNGRCFDIPIIIENMDKNVETKVDILSNIFYKDMMEKKMKMPFIRFGVIVDRQTI